MSEFVVTSFIFCFPLTKIFLVYINDLEQNTKCNLKFFADDTMLYSIVRDPRYSASELNHDLQLISDWAYQWKMSFNPEPKKQAIEVLFSPLFPWHPSL